jgi:hypothetical protein
MGFSFGSASLVSSFDEEYLLLKLHHRWRAEVFPKIIGTSCLARIVSLDLTSALMVIWFSWTIRANP